MNKNNIVICKCGCPNLHRYELEYTHVDGKNSLKCPNHSKTTKGIAQFTIIICIDCGKKESTSMMGARTKIRCTECQHKYAKTIMKKSNEKRAAANKAERDRVKLSKTKQQLKSAGTSLWY